MNIVISFKSISDHFDHHVEWEICNLNSETFYYDILSEIKDNMFRYRYITGNI